MHFTRLRSSASAILAATLLWGCAAKQPAPVLKQDLETITILGLNDLHGALAPLKLKTRERAGVTPVDYERGGAAMLASYVKTLRAEHGSRLLILDAGDEMQGSLESNLLHGSPVVQFFNSIGLQGAAIGNHEFDFGPVENGLDPLGTLKARAKEAKYPFLSANLISKKTGERPDISNTAPSVLLDVGRLKVGVIGLTTLDTPTTSRAEFVKELDFSDLKEATLRESKRLRNLGAHIVVATAHVGLFCNPAPGSPAAKLRGSRVWKPTDSQKECGPRDEMVRLLKSVPVGTLDAVVAGHTHQIVHHWIAGVPVIQSGTRGLQFHTIQLSYDLANNKLIPGASRIEGPVPVCSRVFENQQDCDGESTAPPQGRGRLVKPKFRGKVMEPDAPTEALLEPAIKKAAEVGGTILGEAILPLEYTRDRESAAGNLVADAMRFQLKADVGLINAGGVRSPIEAGPITYEEVFRMLPFENAVWILKLTGKELKLVLRVAENGSRGFFSVSGVQLLAIPLSKEAPATDLNGNHRIEPWEVNRIKEFWLDPGQGQELGRIKDDQYYRLALPDFLVLGGDDMAWVMSQIPTDRIYSENTKLIRELVKDYLAEKQQVNSYGDPTIDPDRPRLILRDSGVKRKAKKSR
ncbi:bifunctional metallophosphatase/5'-nucleotidase [bacterium]|nr:bifunctional metallophosphatase/5'-nucleotidase [bacterium]